LSEIIYNHHVTFQLPLPPNGYSYQATSGQNQPPGYASGYGGFPAQALAANTAAGGTGLSYSGGSIPVAAFATLTADGSRDQVAGVPDTSQSIWIVENVQYLVSI
jgi:hypothetical protein